VTTTRLTPQKLAWRTKTIGRGSLTHSAPITTRFRPLPGHKLAPELVLFPLVTAIRQSTVVTIALLLVLLLISLGPKQQSIRSANLVVPGMLLCTVVITFREDHYLVAMMYFLAFLTLIVAASRIDRNSAYASLMAGLSLYLVGNIAGWLLGIKTISSSVRIAGYQTGGTWFSLRVFFPFSRGINEAAFIAVAFIVAIAAIISMRYKPLWYHWTGAAAGFFVLAASNSRVAILAAPALAVLFFATPRLARATAPYVAGLSMLMPFYLPTLQPVLNWIGTTLNQSTFSVLTRGQSAQSLSAISGRDHIWQSSIKFWDLYVTDTDRQVFGYSRGGHFKSRAVSTYHEILGNFVTDRAALTMHNSLLQTLFDAGVIGAVLLLGVVLITVYRYSQHKELLPMLALAVTLSLSAATEVTLAPGTSNVQVFILLYLAVFMPAKSVVRGAGEDDPRVPESKVTVPDSRRLCQAR